MRDPAAPPEWTGFVATAIVTLLTLIPAEGSPRPAPAATAGGTQTQPSLPIHESIQTSMAKRTPIYFYAPAGGVSGRTAVIFFSGELGWGPLMQHTATRLVAEGRGVLGIDSSLYFRKELTADEWSRDLRKLRGYINRKSRRPPDADVILVGFGCGAEMVPYVLNRWDAATAGGLLLVAPDLDGSAILWVDRRQPPVSVPGAWFDVGEEVRRLPEIPVVLVQGTLDDEAKAGILFAALKEPRRLVTVPGGDRYFNHTLPSFLDVVSEALSWLESDPPPEPTPPADAHPPATPDP